MLRPLITLLMTLLTAALMTGCGFALRGNVDLPAGVEPIYIAGVSSGDKLAVELRNLLTASGIELTEEAEQAQYQLAILEQRKARRSASLGEGARVAEYQLIEIVSYQLLDEKGALVLGPNKITERKIMPNDPNKVVSTAAEETILRREMLQNIAAKIARQLRAFDYDIQPSGAH